MVSVYSLLMEKPIEHTLPEWKLAFLKVVDNFEKHWETNVGGSLNYPAELTHDDWDEQFLTFIGRL